MTLILNWRVAMATGRVSRRAKSQDRDERDGKPTTHEIAEYAPERRLSTRRLETPGPSDRAVDTGRNHYGLVSGAVPQPVLLGSLAFPAYYVGLSLYFQFRRADA